MDNYDIQILKLLQDNSKISTAEIGRTIQLSTTATKERIKKLEEEGIIKGYTTIIDADLVGQALTAFITVPVGDVGIKELGERLVSINEVKECHKVTGNTCFLIKVKAKNHKDLERLVDYINQFAKNTYTYLALSTLKESNTLDL